jgi:hypothetical protein
MCRVFLPKPVRAQALIDKVFRDMSYDADIKHQASPVSLQRLGAIFLTLGSRTGFNRHGVFIPAALDAHGMSCPIGYALIQAILR